MNKLCKSVMCMHHDICRQYETQGCVGIMDVINRQFVDLSTEGKKRFRIIGIPERAITENKISYKLPVKVIDSDDNEEDDIKYLSVSEEEMIEMLNLAKEHFSDKDTNIAYT